MSDPGAQALDEMQLLRDECLEWGVTPGRAVRRVAHRLPDGRRISGLRWGDAGPGAVFLHGGFETAHAWDVVAGALDRPLLALDLIGCGQSDWSEAGTYWPPDVAADLAAAIRALAPTPTVLVGQSYGGLVAASLALAYPNVVRGLVLVDVTPGVSPRHAERVIEMTAHKAGLQASFDVFASEKRRQHPTRSDASLRRSLMHELRPGRQGLWTLRADWRPARWVPRMDEARLWPAVEEPEIPVLLVRGANSRVVRDSEVAELHRRRPDAQMVGIAGASHHIHGDRPIELARAVAEFLDTQARDGEG